MLLFGAEAQRKSYLPELITSHDCTKILLGKKQSTGPIVLDIVHFGQGRGYLNTDVSEKLVQGEIPPTTSCANELHNPFAHSL